MVSMRTAVLAAVFALLTHDAEAWGSSPEVAESHYRRAVALREAIAATNNTLRIAMLGLDMRDALDRALEADPEHVPARIERVRFLLNAPAVVGGGRDRAIAEAAEIAVRDAAAGSFARGYITYREKQFGVARRELRAAAEGATTPFLRDEALTWLGWLSQESQQWDEAFATWERLLEMNPSRADALYEIGRTAVFCECRKERGEAALRRFAEVTAGGARSAEAQKMLKKLLGGTKRPRGQ